MEQRKKAELIEKLQAYFEKELDYDLGQFDAGFLLDFLEKELAPHYYNQGLYDAQVIVSAKMDEVVNAIYEIEKPFSR